MATTMTVSRPTTLHTLAGGCLALAAAMGIGRFAYTPILPAMQRSVGFGTGTAGLLASANYAGYLVGALLIAATPPRVPRRQVLVGCLVAIGITTALMAATTDTLAWGIIRFLSGIASAGVFVLASGLVLGELRREHRISLAGWLYAGVGIGIATSGVVVRVATARLGWRGDWLALAAIAIVAIYPCGRWLPRPAPVVSSSAGQVHADRPPGRAFALLFAAYFLEAVGYIVTGTFLVAIVNRTPGREATGATVWIVVGVAAVPAAVLWTACGLPPRPRPCARPGVRRAGVRHPPAHRGRGSRRLRVGDPLRRDVHRHLRPDDDAGGATRAAPHRGTDRAADGRVRRRADHRARRRGVPGEPYAQLHAGVDRGVGGGLHRRDADGRVPRARRIGGDGGRVRMPVDGARPEGLVAQLWNDSTERTIR